MRLFSKLKVLFYRIYLSVYKSKFKSFGNNNYIWFPVKIIGKSHVEIGNHVTINAFVHIWGHGGISIGNNVLIAAHTVITSLSHEYNNVESTRWAPLIHKKVVIEDDVWIGSSSIIFPGVTIGKGAIIGAGSVVTKNIPANQVWVGNPAKYLKDIDRPLLSNFYTSQIDISEI